MGQLLLYLIEKNVSTYHWCVKRGVKRGVKRVPKLMLSATSGMMCENHMFYKVFAQFGRSVGVLEPFNFAGLSNLCVYVLSVRG